MKILDRMREANAPNARALRRPVRWLVLHKTGISVKEQYNPEPVSDEATNVAEMAARFCRGPMAHYTGGGFPYHFVVLRSGAVEQALALDRCGAHAIGYNACSIAVAFVGETPTTKQHESLLELCRDIMLLERAVLVGHTELPGASADPKKVCPGPDFPMFDFTKKVHAMLPPGWRTANPKWTEMRLATAGYRFKTEATA